MTAHFLAHYWGTVAFYGFRYAVTLIGIMISIFIFRYGWSRLVNGRMDQLTMFLLAAQARRQAALEKRTEALE
jgi:hypothetical protein